MTYIAGIGIKRETRPNLPLLLGEGRGEGRKKMPSVRDIRRRIRSVDNTGKVTNAMSLIAASKMRRAQNAVLQGRPYAEKILDVIAHLAAQPADDVSASQPLLQVRPVSSIAVLVISPDRGLCGGMHANLNRRVGSSFWTRRRRCRPSPWDARGATSWCVPAATCARSSPTWAKRRSYWTPSPYPNC